MGGDSTGHVEPTPDPDPGPDEPAPGTKADTSVPAPQPGASGSDSGTRGTEADTGPSGAAGGGGGQVAVGTRVAVYVSRAWWGLVVGYGALIAVVGPLLIAEQRDGGYCESIDHPGDCGSAGEAFGLGLLMVGVGAAGLFAAAALRAGRPWGRWATAGAFGLWALVAAALAVQVVVRPDDGGLDSDVVGPLIGVGLALAVVVLAARSDPTPGPS